MEAGAVDFLVKGRTDAALLERTIRYAITQAEATFALERSLAQVEGLERAGRLLAERGLSEEALAAVLDIVVSDLGQQGSAIYLMVSGFLELAAERGYGTAVASLDPAGSRLAPLVARGTPSFVTAIAADPDSESQRAMELAVPLMSRSACLGLLLVSSPDGEPLSGADYHAVVAIADRVAVTIALTDEREELAARATRMARLVAFARTVGATLDAERLHEEIVCAAATVVPADVVLLAMRDSRADEGIDVVRAVLGGPSSVHDILAAHPAGGDAGESLALMPASADLLLERDERAIGRLVFVRHDPQRPFNAGEQEAIRLMGGLVVLALGNVASHAEVAERSVKDPLTGLSNRRFFDRSLAQLTAQRARRAPESRGSIAAVLYDLDNFGAINKQHGHAIGDAVLRNFAAVFLARSRESDIVARYGGEEFVAVMTEATREDAMRVADEVLAAFAATAVMLDDGSELKVTVSAGCAALPAEENDLDGLLRTADVGLSFAKRAGRNMTMAA